MNKYVRKNRSLFIGAIVSILVSTSFAVILQFFKGNILDYAVAGDSRETIKYAILLIGSILVEIGFYFLYSLLSARFVVNCTQGLKTDIFNSLLNRNYIKYKERLQGEYIAKYTNEADLIKERRFSMLPMLWEIVLKVLLVSAALFFLDWRIALITIFLLTTPLYVPKLIEKSLQDAQANYIKAVETNLAKINDWLSGFEIIKNFSIEHHIMRQFHEVNDDTMNKMFKDMRLGLISRLITTLLSYLSYFVILAIAAYLVLAREFSVGDFFIAIGMIDQLSYPLISLSGIIRQLVAIRPSCQTMEAFIKNTPAKAKRNTISILNDEIRFSNISFSYDETKPLLHDFNLALEKGKRYLVKGPSGCGKTTLINLMLGYYDPEKGQVTIDGVPITNYDDTYGLITIVRQNTILFHDTLRNNLTMYQDVKDSSLISLLKALGLSKFAHLNALDSMVTENGTNLSGGEKKRICLARALLRDTEVLVLDEPLANLDYDNARAIETLLLNLIERTMVVVSHQFSPDLMKGFDRVIEMG
ncbi:MAG: ABC transporter ATP-binding protein [Chloroflexota bacterium]|nr:ABC transporter ATP-binding protein [Chloroflexota bacterium]